MHCGESVSYLSIIKDGTKAAQITYICSEGRIVPFFLKLFLISFLTLASMQITDPVAKTRGLRIDTGYFYSLYPGLNVDEIANKVVSKASASGVNTLFIYAYNPVYGALYTTEYRYALTEGGYGRSNILKQLTLEAKKYGLKVVACVPVNNFKEVWTQKPAWRAKTIYGDDYIPADNMYLLSAWHPEFRKWLEGFYKDLFNKNPYIDGIEAVEPFIDYRWQKESDYNPVSNNLFKTFYPSSNLGDSTWLNFRAQGLTDLIGIMNLTASLYKKTSYMIHTWPALADGKLYPSVVIKDNAGLDLDGILHLHNNKKLKYLTAELIWQQWAAEYGPANFPVSWTRQASLEFINYVNTRSTPLIHVEVTPFIGSGGNIVTPTLNDFENNLISIRDLKVGVDVYDYSQIEYLEAWKELLAWY